MLVKLASYHDVPEGGSLYVRGPAGLEIALFRVQGEIFALNNACPHQGAPLAEGQLQGYCITCPWHAWDFDVRTGECLTYPEEDAQKITIKVQEEEIYLEYELA
jgi:nitrite reductase/ring-hydroxylating ferredoxin subunit